MITNLRPYFERVDALWGGDRIPGDDECPVPPLRAGSESSWNQWLAELAAVETYWKRRRAERVPEPAKRRYPMAELFAAIDADPDGRPYPQDAQLSHGEVLALSEYRVERREARLKTDHLRMENDR